MYIVEARTAEYAEEREPLTSPNGTDMNEQESIEEDVIGIEEGSSKIFTRKEEDANEGEHEEERLLGSEQESRASESMNDDGR